MLEIRIIACQGDLLLLDSLFVVERQHCLFGALVANPLLPRHYGVFVAG